MSSTRPLPLGVVLTRSFPSSRPFGLPLYVAQFPFAPFIHMRIRPSYKDCHLLLQALSPFLRSQNDRSPCRRHLRTLPSLLRAASVQQRQRPPLRRRRRRAADRAPNDRPCKRLRLTWSCPRRRLRFTRSERHVSRRRHRPRD